MVIPVSVASCESRHVIERIFFFSCKKIKNKCLEQVAWKALHHAVLSSSFFSQIVLLFYALLIPPVRNLPWVIQVYIKILIKKGEKEKSPPEPLFIFISPLFGSLTPHRSELLGLYFYALSGGADPKMSVSAKRQQCAHVTCRSFIHHSVRLMYKVPSLPVIFSHTSVEIQMGRWDKQVESMPDLLNKWWLPRGSGLSSCQVL